MSSSLEPVKSPDMAERILQMWLGTLRQGGYLGELLVLSQYPCKREGERDSVAEDEEVFGWVTIDAGREKLLFLEEAAISLEQHWC